MKIQLTHSFEDIISIDNLLEAWKEFVKGKRSRKDVQEFERNLMSNIILLHQDLAAKTYRHAPYETFNISDPKPRNIHKASVRDRLLHHALYRILYPFFEKTFIADSYSCRLGKGTHQAMKRFRAFAYQASKNHTKTVWVLKCDIRKFFQNIDQGVLLDLLRQYISDKNILWLLESVIRSFSGLVPGKSLPLGNLTSQLLVNIYMNEFDQFVKHRLKVKYYVRYADDFVILSENRDWVLNFIPLLRRFLGERLKLELHPQKVFIKTFASGVDFLGWVHFPDHRVLRTSTKRRMMKRVRELKSWLALNSYLGLLSHGNGYKLKEGLLGLKL